MRKKHSKQEKAKIVLELLREEKTLNQIASEYGVHPSQLSQWKKTALEGLPDLFERKERELRKIEKEHQKEVDHLYKKIGDLTIQVDWLKKNLKKLCKVDPSVVWQLATGQFVTNRENVILVGNPGTGKTHLAIGLGMKLCA